MISDTKGRRVLNILLPLSLYILIGLLSQAGSGRYEVLSAVFEKGAAAALFIWMFFKDLQRIYWKKVSVPYTFWAALFSGSICLCVGMNTLFSLTGLTSLYAESYENITDSLYHGQLFFEILVLVILSPLAEEFLFRGVIFKRIRTYASFLPAAAVSALFFAAFHGNALQFMYGFAAGLWFSLCYERTHSILFPVLAHAAANAVSLLFSVTGWIPEGNIPLLFTLTVLCLLTVALVCVLVRRHIPDDSDNRGVVS